ncbi:MAG TPA: type II toxin-antitoxin system VapC family toxin [Spirochaetota bacterium]|nr:type II toxin-antitoxin system VapC family toxin [Spirochaetota bacterium]HRZ27780.1 type II toxin-antitoxin system VapC family toxin [Spirochaetota bacterium]HSA13735.1 type II toxin-antitoxin system VapC family toxin [Spirochaetota bacterium]
MNITIDTSALMAVIAGEPERNRIIELTAGNTLIGPGSIPWEIGNAFSAMFKQNRITFKEAQRGLSIFNSIPIRYVETDLTSALKLSKTENIYAYDSYMLDCAIQYKSPLLTLDKKLESAARRMKIAILEV